MELASSCCMRKTRSSPAGSAKGQGSTETISPRSRRSSSVMRDLLLRGQRRDGSHWNRWQRQHKACDAVVMAGEAYVSPLLPGKTPRHRQAHAAAATGGTPGKEWV